MKSIGEAIQYLHSINIAHRDVKVGAVLSPALPQRCWGCPSPALTSCPLFSCSQKTSCTPPKGPMLC